MASPPDNSLAQIYAALVLGSSLGLVGTAWLMSHLYAHALHRVRPADRQKYISIAWGWMLAGVLTRAQGFNLALFMFTISTPHPWPDAITGNLPSDWSSLITLGGWLVLFAVLWRTLPYIREGISPEETA